MTQTLVLVLLAVAIAAAAVLLRQRGSGRQQALRQVLDAADDLEDRLRAARNEIEAIAGNHDNPVLEAQQEMLRQRLWLQQHGHDATLQELVAVRDSIIAGRRRIDQQLLKVERARGTLP